MQDSEATALSEATAGDVVLPWLAMAKSENAENAGHAELESDLCCVVPSVSSELSIALGQAGDDVPFAWVSIKSYRRGRLLDMKTNRSLSLGCLLHKTSKLPGYSL